MTEVMPRQSVRPEPPEWAVRCGLDVCRHCKDGHHLSCMGAVRVPVSKKAPHGVIVCYCGVCDPPLRCLDCGNQFPEDVIPELWRCFDKNMCQGRIVARIKQDRIWRMIQECKTAAALLRKQARRERDRIKDQTLGEPEDRVLPRVPKPTSGQCECCGAPTKGGKFAPGHDARLKSKLRKAANGGDKQAYKQLVERGWVS